MHQKNFKLIKLKK